MRFLTIYQVIVSLTCLFMVTAYAAASSIDQAKQAFERGQFEQAVQHWQKVLQESPEDLPQQVEAQLGLATAYQALGFYKLGLSDEEPCKMFDKASSAAKKMSDPTWRVKVLMGLADCYLATYYQSKGTAKQSLEEAEQIARQVRQPSLLAQVLNKQGNLAMLSKDHQLAIETYQKSLVVAQQTKDASLIARIRLNLALTLPFRTSSIQASLTELAEVLRVVQQLSPASHLKSFGLLALSQIPKSIQKEKGKFTILEQPQARNLTWRALEDAQISAEQTGDERAWSYALGLKGELYEQDKRYDEAIQLTRQALFRAQQTPMVTPLHGREPTSCTLKTQQTPSSVPELTYRWYWQLGRLLQAQNHSEEAIKMYQNAVNQLRFVRRALINDSYRYARPNFKEEFAPLYLELIDLLLQQATHPQLVRPNQQQRGLQQAQEVIELLKEEEIKDYLQLDCLFAAPGQRMDQYILPHTAVLYPIFLSKDAKLKLLLRLPDVSYYLVDVIATGQDVKDKVDDFRGKINYRQEVKDDEANQLYNLLIAPLEAKLTEQQVNTLIVVPDGKLRDIPFAALYDGKKFLLEKYLLASVQNLELTNGEQSSWDTIEVLLGGVSEAVDKELGPLPHVVHELQGIQELFSHNSVLLDRPFTGRNLTAKLKLTSYNIIHIASHAGFGSDPNDPKQTFLLTYPDRLELNKLEELIQSRKSEKPLELMTLSACETAKGDDRAALGLAGITLKSGAKSALASLWQVNDEATAKLMTEFYRQLLQQPMKARALQEAQKTLLNNPKYQHPYYWAAFLIIGNWL